MTSALELRYRWVLRVLPAPYRAAWQEEMVATFLAGMVTGDAEQDEFQAEYGRPGWGEVASVLWLAVRLRVTGAAPLAGTRPWGAAVRTVALVGLLSHAALAAAGLLGYFWLYGRIPGWTPPPDAVLITGSTGRWVLLAGLLTLAVLPAYLALLFGARRAARALALLALAAGLALRVLRSDFWGSPVGTSVFVLVVDALLVLALWSFTPDAPPVPRRPWLLALAVGATATAVLILGFAPDRLPGQVLDWPGLCCLAFAATAGYQGVRARRAPVPGYWPLALALLAPVLLGYRLLMTFDLVGSGILTSPVVSLVAGLAGALLTLLAGGWMALLAVRVPAGPVPVRSRRARA